MMNQHLPTSATTGDARTLNVIECAGIRYCTVHDDFAMESYTEVRGDLRPLCREAVYDFQAYGLPGVRPDGAPPHVPCCVVPMFTEATS